MPQASLRQSITFGDKEIKRDVYMGQNAADSNCVCIIGRGTKYKHPEVDFVAELGR
jgi:hypothetical protein